MALVAGLNSGDLIAGKYRVGRIIGRGGMSVVLDAVHIGLDEPVAIKVLLPEAIENDVVLARFEREARATAKIKSEHVTRVADVGKLEGDTPYIVMERLEGEDLGARLKRGGALPVEVVSRYVLQTCEALAEAHAIGIVHRDLKPDNLFVTTRRGGAEVVKVLDFGISKAMAPEQAAMTRTSTIIGSPLYMSPEQLRNPKGVDHRTDIWTLGVVLYELTTARPPFPAKNLRELAFAIVGNPPTPMQRIVPQIPAAFEAVVKRCLAKDRQKRYQTIAELAAALAPFSPAQGRISMERTGALQPVSAEPLVDQHTSTGTVRLSNGEAEQLQKVETEAAQAAIDTSRTLPVAPGLGDENYDDDDEQDTVLIDTNKLPGGAASRPGGSPGQAAPSSLAAIPSSAVRAPQAKAAPNSSALDALPAERSGGGGTRPEAGGTRPEAGGTRPEAGPSPWSSQSQEQSPNGSSSMEQETWPEPVKTRDGGGGKTLLVAAVLGLLLAGGIAYALLRPGPPPDTAPSAPAATSQPPSP